MVTMALAGLMFPSPGLQAQQFVAVDAAVRAGITRGLYPGAVVVIGRADTVLYARGYGHLTWSAGSAAPNPDSTIWDLASLSKVVGTTSAVLRMVDAGSLSLDAPVSRFRALRKDPLGYSPALWRRMAEQGAAARCAGDDGRLVVRVRPHAPRQRSDS